MLYLTCASCLDWSRREDIQTGTVKGFLSWTGRRYLAGTVRGRSSWYNSLLPEVQGTPSWFIGLELEQHEDQAQRMKSRVQAQSVEVQNGSSADQVQYISVVFKCRAVYKYGDKAQMSTCVFELVIIQVLLAEPLGSLAFKMVQVRMLESEQKVKLESAVGRLLVEQNNRENGQSSSSRGPSNDDPQEKFRRQKPKEFSGTTDPLVAESWIKSMEVIFEYLQMSDLDRPRCAIYMLRENAMIWREGAKLSVDLLNLTWADFKQVFFEQYVRTEGSDLTKCDTK
ncbi:hypothetical protein F511_17111 [Dorcoceras hygrometricum]|uniref:Uncharacterized protein n=1 Tax=Dorcoceras hygrometricum TaxID=472368 RepID=A0A2Z7CNA4_9LAMI|nr:hypothetical protein F511_17111 [Dorcoceras hygrometricum]